MTLKDIFGTSVASLEDIFQSPKPSLKQLFGFEPYPVYQKKVEEPKKTVFNSLADKLSKRNSKESMNFNNATIPQSSTNIARQEAQKGLYNNQDGSVFNSPLFGELKNKVGMNYEDAQIAAWREGLKTGSPQLAAQMGNNPALSNVDITGGIKSVGSVGKNILKNIPKNILAKVKSDDIAVMEDFINYARSKSVANPELEKSARYFAEGFGLNPNITNAKLANQLEPILEQSSKLERSVNPLFLGANK